MDLTQFERLNSILRERYGPCLLDDEPFLYQSRNRDT